MFDFEFLELEKNKPNFSPSSTISDRIELKKLEQNYFFLTNSISLKQEHSLLVQRLWKTYTKDEAKESIDTYQELVVDCEKAEKLKSFLQNFQNLDNLEVEAANIKNEIEEIDLKCCPVCNSTLKCIVSSRELILVQRKFEPKTLSSSENIEMLQLKLSRILKAIEKRDELKALLQQYVTSDLPSSESVKADLVEMMTYSLNNKADENKIELISKKIAAIPILVENDPISLSTQIKSLSEIIYKNELESKQFDSYTSKKEALKKRTPDFGVLSTLQEQLESNTNLIYDIEKNISSLASLQRKANIYQQYKSALTKYLSINKEIDLVQTKEKEISLEYQALLTLNSKILEAESIALGNFIDLINEKVQFFIDHFFDSEMIVKLKAFKPSKKIGVSEKPQINLEVEYKGEESDVNCLSGGEYSRLVLAFNLAFVQISNCPLVLLDECTSSLDSENTSNVFEKIIDFFPDRIVIAVAHQVIEGQFLSVIKI
jgi:DNA repair ATPase RecN